MSLYISSLLGLRLCNSVGVMPADWRFWNPLCDVTKSQDVACVADVKPLAEHRKRSPVRCNLSTMVRTVFFFLSFLNSWSQVLWIQVNLIEEGDVWHEWVSSRDLWNLGCSNCLVKWKSGPFLFGLWYGPCLAVSEQRSSLFLTAERMAIFLVDISFCVHAFWCFLYVTLNFLANMLRNC